MACGGYAFLVDKGCDEAVERWTLCLTELSGVGSRQVDVGDRAQPSAAFSGTTFGPAATGAVAKRATACLRSASLVIA
jgi:hypothetical protein